MSRSPIGLALVSIVAASTLRAQDTLPPAQGGYVHSLGLPSIYKPYGAVGIGFYRTEGMHLTAQLRAGVFRDIGSPVTELVGWSLESYVGVRDVRLDYGARAFLLSHLLGIGAGVDYSVPEARASPLVTLVAPVRRGGILGYGSDLRLEWLPGQGGSFNIAVTMPVGQPHRGKTRPARSSVSLLDEPARPLAFTAPHPSLVDALARVREHAGWINRLTVPDLGGLAANPGQAALEVVAPLRTRIASRSPGFADGHTVEAEIRAYHRELDRAFSIAVADRPMPPGGSVPLGVAAAASAKAILLERVLFPYNYLIGQPKRDDTTRGFGSHARGLFARWLTMASAIPAGHDAACLYVFQSLLDVVEEIRATNRRTWRDSRLVWLPLQLALLPEEYDEQQELDSLISHAVGHPITHGNRIWYVHNDRFQLELVKSIGRAQDYHVLWIHDFRGLNDAGKPDRLSLLTATQAYLGALRDHLARYDSIGRLPVYMIFIDQHYFEQRKSRALLRFLEDPLGRTPALPPGSDSLALELTVARARLREAVAQSRLLQVERAQYGEQWLHRLVKVHVSVTNPADPSFRSPQILPLLGVPDDVIRDHRKAVLYDVSEASPYRGMAMYAGMGVGEHYVGPAWEDRAIMVQGPVALMLRDKARALLAVQGIRGGELPYVLRSRPKGPDYDRRVQAEIDSMDAWGGVATRAVELHNETGFGSKEISVAEATLINLLSPGGVWKVPDSLWLNEFLGSLLVGAALRGTRVLIIAPSRATAPGKAWPTLALAHDLMSRLVAVQRELAPEFARGGGFLRVGIYNPVVGVDDLRDRVRALRRSLSQTPFLHDLYAFDPAVYALLDSSDAILGAAGDDSVRRTVPMLHFKGFLYISREAWRRLISGPAMAFGLHQYLVQRTRQLREGPAVGEDVMADAMQMTGAGTINQLLDSLPLDERACPRFQHCPGKRWVFFLQIGSPNQDYRSMALDGEAAVLVSGWTSLYALPDFVLLAGLTTWPDTQEELDRLLPPPTERQRVFAWWVRMLL